MRVGECREGKDFIEMGFADRRRRLKERIPDWSWRTLKEFARNQGEVSVNDKNIPERIRKNLKFYIHIIRMRLEAFFNIDGSPFNPYNRSNKSYSTIFNLIDESQD